MKTTIKQIATGTLIVLLSFAINASAHDSKAKASIHENNYETALSIESWMIDESVFTFSPSDEFANEQETQLVVESWMTDSNEWFSESEIEFETEKALTIENWMLENSSIAYSLENSVTETALVVEGWMTE